MGSDDERMVKTTTRSFQILEYLHEQEGAGISEIAAALGMSKSTVYKHLRTLAAERYVVTEPDGTYSTGLRFLALGVGARRQRSIYETAKPEIQQLAETSGEMANLMVEEHGRGVFLYRADSNRAVNLDTHAGREVYLHTTAMGKAILAHYDTETVDEIVDRHGLPQKTPHTITDRETLSNEFETIRERGWATDREERLEGLCCVATPITTPAGTPLGAISISGPQSRLKDERMESELPERLLDARNVIELNVAYD